MHVPWPPDDLLAIEERFGKCGGLVHVARSAGFGISINVPSSRVRHLRLQASQRCSSSVRSPCVTRWTSRRC